MRNTITSKNGGYKCRKLYRNEEHTEFLYMVLDGETPIMYAEPVSREFYLEEKEGNECFNFCEVFTTVKGNQFIYFRDEEIDVDYIVNVNKGAN